VSDETTRAKSDDQLAFDEKVIDDPDLEEALEDREKVKSQRSALNAKFKEKHEQAVELIDELDITEDTVIRCGRFRVSKSPVAPRSVEFTTNPTERLTISTVE
jgi:hypothetical protein